MVNAALSILRAGALWRVLPERFGPWETAYGWFNQWSADDTWDRVSSRLHSDMDRAGRIDWELFCIDGSSVERAGRLLGLEKKGKGRAGRSRAGPLLGRICEQGSSGV